MKISFSLLFILFSMAIFAQEKTLTVHFSGTQNKGQVLVKIVNEKDEKVMGKIIPAKAGKTSFSTALPNGKYAVSAVYDENSNEEMDTNFMGIPTENYGFSNDARGRFGPPKLEDQLFELNENKTISIELK